MATGCPPRLRLFDILNAIHAIEIALASKTYDEFREPEILQRAVERWLEIVSEATRGIPDEWRARAPDIPWRAIENFGNKTRHEYQSINPRRVWETATLELDALRKVCATLYAEAKRPADPWPDAESK